MPRINQHGPDEALYDIKAFLPVIDRFFEVEEWNIEIDWCSGENAVEIQEKTDGGIVLTDREFRTLYAGIFQTIDGKFQLFAKSQLLASLEAIDSSWWEVESANAAFEEEMASCFGTYKYPA